MFSHIVLGSDCVHTSKKFYDAVLSALGIENGIIDEKGRCNYITTIGTLCITRPINGKSTSHGNGVTIGFTANSIEMVKQWFDSGIMSGGAACEDPPGIRNSPVGEIYQAFLRDPYGNKLCATFFLPN